MVQVDLDYTGTGGKNENTEEGKKMPGAIIGDGDLLEMENTGENWRSSKKKERRVKVIIIIIKK